jgi:TfoX/Sxy family transcriptional regulator of competence genes
MAWVKIPKEHHPLFRAALPKNVTTKNMFGSVAAFVNDNLFGGLFARSIMVKLSPEHQQEALALDGAERFDPMDNGRVMGNSVMLPESVMDDPAEMKMWLQRGYDYVATLPAKKKKPTRKPAKKPATRTVKRAQKRKR